jgi:hypothetical protein
MSRSPTRSLVSHTKVDDFTLLLGFAFAKVDTGPKHGDQQCYKHWTVLSCTMPP